MIKRIICLALLFMLSIQFVPPVFSEQKEDSNLKKVTLLKGATAPFDGVLFNEEKVKELRQIKFEWELEKDLRKQEKELLLRKLDESKVPWYEKPTVRTLWGMFLAYMSVFVARQL